MRRSDLSELIDCANILADAAREPALRYFRQDSLSVENKRSDGFDPVTEADRAVERTLREQLAELRPQDAIVGEEYGAQPGRSEITWIVDPIDGTRAFVVGAPTWGVLIAAATQTGVLCGVIDQPFTQERFIGAGGTCTWHRHGKSQKLQTRKTNILSEARLMTTFPELGTEKDRAGFESVAQNVKLVRYGLDCYAYALLAAGQIDLVIEAGLASYDVAGPIGVIEAAGGVVTTWSGGSALQGGQVLASANPTIHAKALKMLSDYAV
ncbi:MAG: inositol monophosphatase family protein [Pseudomonadota bacterium]